MRLTKPKLAVFKFASCDGCQLTLLDCEDDFLAIADKVRIAHFPEATRAVIKGPYDIALVEGSITTPHDAKRIQSVRKSSRFLITIGACATSGGIQALRNWKDVNELSIQFRVGGANGGPPPRAASEHGGGNSRQDPHETESLLNEFKSIVYARPEYIETLATSTPIAAHVKVDLELCGCPINKQQLLEVLTSLLNSKKPNLPKTSVCMDCKRQGISCILVVKGEPCMGPITQTGCGALCPKFGRPCYGCFGPTASPHVSSLTDKWRELGKSDAHIDRMLHSFHSYTQPLPETTHDA